MSIALPEPLLADDALPRVLEFSRRFGPRSTLLAMHAALPLGLSPELVHLLRVNFVREAPFIAEADLLLSPLCREVGGGLYEMDAGVRDLLLGELGRAPRYGPERLREVAEFLFHYAAAGLLDAVDADARDHLRVQQWVGLSYLAPERAAEELARTLRAGVERGDRGEALRVVRLTGALATPLLGQVELMRYAGAIARAAAGDASGAVLVAGAGESVTAAEPVVVGRETLPGIERAIGLWGAPNSRAGAAAPATPDGSREAAQGTEAPRAAGPYRAARVLVLGDPGVGKTTVAAALADVSDPDQRAQPPIRWETRAGSGGDGVLDVFFAERERLDTPAGFWLRGEMLDAAAIVIVAGGAPEVERWLANLEGIGFPWSRVVLVHTGVRIGGAALLKRAAEARGLAGFVDMTLARGTAIESARRLLRDAVSSADLPSAASRDDVRVIESRVRTMLEQWPFVRLTGGVRSQLRHALPRSADVESRLDRALNCLRVNPEVHVLGAPAAGLVTAPMYTETAQAIAAAVSMGEGGLPCASPDALFRHGVGDGPLTRELLEMAIDEWVRLGWAYRARTRRGPRVVVPWLLRTGTSWSSAEPESLAVEAQWNGGFADPFVLLLVHLAHLGRVDVQGPASARIEREDAWVQINPLQEDSGLSRMLVYAGGADLDVADLRREVRDVFATYLPEGAEVRFTEPEEWGRAEPEAAARTLNISVVLPLGHKEVAGRPIDLDQLWHSLYGPALDLVVRSRRWKADATRETDLPASWDDAPPELRNADLVLVDVTWFHAGDLHKLRLLPGARTQQVVLFQAAVAPVPELLREFEVITYEFTSPAGLQAQVEHVAGAIRRVLDIPSTRDGAPAENADDAAFEALLKEAAQVAPHARTDAVPLYARLIEERPDDPRAYIALAGLYERTGRVEDAESLLRRGLEAMPTSTDIYLRLGLHLEQSRRLDEAEEVYRRGLSAVPGDGDLYVALGALLERTERRDEALETYRLATSSAPGHPELHFRLGTLLAAQHQFEAAEESYRAGLAAAPRNAPLIGALGRLLLARGAHGEAIELYYDGLEREPHNPDLLMGLGAALERAGDLGGAERAYLEAVPFRQAVGETDADWAVAELLARRGEYERALTHYRTVADRRPEWGYCLIRMAESELRLAGRISVSEELEQRFGRTEAILSEPGKNEVPQFLATLAILQLFRGDSTQFMQYLLRAVRNAKEPQVLARDLEILNGLEDVERLLPGLGDGIELLREALGHTTPEMSDRADSAAGGWEDAGPGVMLRVTAQVLNVRAENGRRAASLAKAREGDRLEQLERRGDWVRVRTPTGIVGWVSAGGVVTDTGREPKLDAPGRPLGFGHDAEVPFLKPEEPAEKSARTGPPLLVLYVISLPGDDMVALQTDRELREMQRSANRGGGGEHLQFDLRITLRPDDLAHALLELRPGILHLSGPGTGETTDLRFEGESGRDEAVSADALGTMLQAASDSLQCVVLNGVYDPTRAVILLEAVPFVIAIPAQIELEAALAFGGSFYEALSAGRSIPDAFSLALITLELTGPIRDLPALYSRTSGPHDAAA